MEYSAEYLTKVKLGFAMIFIVFLIISQLSLCTVEITAFKRSIIFWVLSIRKKRTSVRYELTKNQSTVVSKAKILEGVTH